MSVGKKGVCHIRHIIITIITVRPFAGRVGGSVLYVLLLLGVTEHTLT